jgi:hypothetical protein
VDSDDSPFERRALGPDVAQTVWAETEGERVVIHNFRNLDYRSSIDFIPRWETKIVYLTEICSIDLFVLLGRPMDGASGGQLPIRTHRPCSVHNGDAAAGLTGKFDSAGFVLNLRTHSFSRYSKPVGLYSAPKMSANREAPVGPSHHFPRILSGPVCAAKHSLSPNRSGRPCIAVPSPTAFGPRGYYPCRPA